MEHINIISKIAITKPAFWLPLIVTIIAVIGLVTALIHMYFTKKTDFAIKLQFIFGVGGIAAQLLSMVIAAAFFQVPTGQYRYEATIDKDNITVSEYEEFIETYNPTIIDGVYYWEGE